MKVNQIIEGHHYSNGKKNKFELHRKIIQDYDNKYVKVLTTYVPSTIHVFQGFYVMPKKSFARWAKEDIT